MGWLKKGFIYGTSFEMCMIMTEFDRPEVTCAVDRTLNPVTN